MAVFPTTADTGTVGGTVPSVLDLQLGSVPSLGAFIPGVARTYTTQTTATVTSTAGDATLTVTDPDGTGRLTNGAFTLRLPVRVNGVAAPAALKTWGRTDGRASRCRCPSSRRSPPDEPLRTGAYSKTLVVHPFDRDAVTRCRRRVPALNSVSTPRSSAESRGGSMPTWRAKSAPS